MTTSQLRPLTESVVILEGDQKKLTFVKNNILTERIKLLQRELNLEIKYEATYSEEGTYQSVKIFSVITITPFLNRNYPIEIKVESKPFAGGIKITSISPDTGYEKNKDIPQVKPIQDNFSLNNAIGLKLIYFYLGLTYNLFFTINLIGLIEESLYDIVALKFNSEISNNANENNTLNVYDIKDITA